MKPTSLFEYIESHVDAIGVLKVEDICFPERSELLSKNTPAWIPGANEESRPYHGAKSIRNENKVDYIADLVVRISKDDDTESKSELYRQLLKDDLIGFIDPLLEKIGIYADLQLPHLNNLAKDVAFKSPDRGPVRFGITLLGLVGDEHDMNRVLTLGKHGYLTRYSIIAVKKAYNDSAVRICLFGERLTGYAKIELIESLSNTGESFIKNWLLLEGYKGVEPGDLCKVAGLLANIVDLKVALSNQNVDQKTLIPAGKIIEAIVEDRFQEGEIYTELPDTIILYLNLLIRSENVSNHLLTVDIIEYYLLKNNSWISREYENWSSDQATLIQELIHRIKE